ncbi:hypothetical protein [Halorubellus litoreus]|uniref:Uncharacterized protein n=1 Tax=Halorubellus litoreus TaxID=755308 RepID=A0ABD5VA01_9EURY
MKSRRECLKHGTVCALSLGGIGAAAADSDSNLPSRPVEHVRVKQNGWRVRNVQQSRGDVFYNGWFGFPHDSNLNYVATEDNEKFPILALFAATVDPGESGMFGWNPPFGDDIRKGGKKAFNEALSSQRIKHGQFSFWNNWSEYGLSYSGSLNLTDVTAEKQGYKYSPQWLKEDPDFEAILVTGELPSGKGVAIGAAYDDEGTNIKKSILEREAREFINSVEI